MADHVHPTAFGQVAIAERALDVLAADGLDVRVRPSTLIRHETHARCGRAAGDWTYAYRHAQGQCARFCRSSSGSMRRAA